MLEGSYVLLKDSMYWDGLPPHEYQIQADFDDSETVAASSACSINEHLQMPHDPDPESNIGSKSSLYSYLY
jgi:hypothetical protein